MKKTLLLALAVLVLPVTAAQRIVSLSPALTELVVHLGGEQALIGRSSACDWPASIQKLPVMGDFARPDLERIVAARADLVVTNDLVNPGIAAALQRHGIPLLNLPCRNAAEYMEVVRQIADALGVPAEPELERICKALARFREMPPLPLQVLVIVWGNPVIAAGRGTYPAEVVQMAGARLPEGGSGYFKPSLEWLMQTPVDLVIVPDNKILPALKRNRAFSQKRLIVMAEGELLSRPGPRWIQGVEQLRKTLEGTSL